MILNASAATTTNTVLLLRSVLLSGDANQEGIATARELARRLHRKEE